MGRPTSSINISYCPPHLKSSAENDKIIEKTVKIIEKTVISSKVKQALPKKNICPPRPGVSPSSKYRSFNENYHPIVVQPRKIFRMAFGSTGNIYSDPYFVTVC